VRSERLLGIVAVLQARGRSTAPELAEEFAVSVKTIQRDMEALSRGGVPVFASRGAGGGWELLPNYRSSLTGLAPAEALAIVIGRPQGLLGDLGFDDSGDRAIMKLLGTLPPGDRERARRARERLLIDRDLWSFAAEPEPLLPDLYRAVCDDLVVRIRYTDARADFDIAPLGLVYKRNAWYLLAKRRDQYRTYRVARMRELAVTSRTFDRHADFDLHAEWATATTSYAESLPSYPVELRVAGEALARLSRIAVRQRTVEEPEANGWAVAQLEFFDEPEARAAIRRLGIHVEIISPAHLREVAMEEASTFLDDNRDL